MEVVLFGHLRDSPSHESQNISTIFFLVHSLQQGTSHWLKDLTKRPERLIAKLRDAVLAQECLWVSKTTMQSLHGRHKM